jgi:hypothetical protein
MRYTQYAKLVSFALTRCSVTYVTGMTRLLAILGGWATGVAARLLMALQGYPSPVLEHPSANARCRKPAAATLVYGVLVPGHHHD